MKINNLGSVLRQMEKSHLALDHILARKNNEVPIGIIGEITTISQRIKELERIMGILQ